MAPLHLNLSQNPDQSLSQIKLLLAIIMAIIVILIGAINALHQLVIAFIVILDNVLIGLLLSGLLKKTNVCLVIGAMLKVGTIMLKAMVIKSAPPQNLALLCL